MKDYVLLFDSVGDGNALIENFEEVIQIPLTMRIDEEEFMADGHIPLKELLFKIRNAKSCPKTACPGPGVFLEQYEKYKEKEIYVVCVSDKLSGAYVSACNARDIFLEEHPKAHIAVFNSFSASAGIGLFLRMIMRFKEEEKEFEAICESMHAFKEKIHTLFVLEDLTFLEKNGRLTGLAKAITHALKISPILQGIQGSISMKDKAISNRRAIAKLIEIVAEDIEKEGIKLLCISHCNCPEKAEEVRNSLKKRFSDLIIHIDSTGPCSSLYAGDQGIVISY